MKKRLAKKIVSLSHPDRYTSDMVLRASKRLFRSMTRHSEENFFLIDDVQQKVDDVIFSRRAWHRRLTDPCYESAHTLISIGGSDQCVSCGADDTTWRRHTPKTEREWSVWLKTSRKGVETRDAP